MGEQMAREILERMQALAEEDEAEAAAARMERQEAAPVSEVPAVPEKEMRTENIDGSEAGMEPGLFDVKEGQTFGDFDEPSDEPQRENTSKQVAKNLLYIVGGVYLMYLAYQIFQGMRTEGVSPGVNPSILVGAIVLFALAGLVLTVMNVIDIAKRMKK